MDRNYNQKNKDSLDQLELTSILTRTRDGISELTSALETMERMMDTVRDITTKDRSASSQCVDRSCKGRTSW
jgi:hypothetical protein